MYLSLYSLHLFDRTLSSFVEATMLGSRCAQLNIFLFLNQNICCGYSKEPSQRDDSFEHPKLMFELVVKKLFTILQKIFCLYGRMQLGGDMRFPTMLFFCFVSLRLLNNLSVMWDGLPGLNQY